ncbi:penicillin-binding protein activator [Algibacillus agarilyticus]|uniref:penicillin-binding protein activator n=1 Tax=Algibacillus agarilyticus TaxID=2234133 RepID=UPI000DD0DE93|nr:penicillin-binding protein activator [Algibacillus agarilyticus]
MKSFHRWLYIMACSSLLLACGGTPKPVVPKVEIAKPSIKEAPKRKKVLTADDYIQRAAEATSLAQSTLWYTRAADLWVQEQNYTKAQSLLNQLDSTLLTPYMQQQFKLFKAEALLGLQQPQLSYNIALDLPIIKNFELRSAQIKAQSAIASKNTLTAIRALITLKNHTSPETHSPINENIWQQLNLLEKAALKNFQDITEFELSGWLRLLNITRIYANTPADMLVNIRHWQAQYPAHPAAEQLPNALQLALQIEPYKPYRVTVFLPLSGKFSRQGQSVQQGILAANYDPQNLLRLHELTFLDSETTDFSTLELETDFIIGPLLKHNISKVTERFVDIPVLLLNQTDDLTLTQQQFTFSLSPEGEAIQAADKLAELGYKAPIVIAANNAYGRRVAETFAKTYTEKADITPEVAYFKNTQEMKTTVEALLDTASSHKRIKTLKSLFGNPSNFNADARNRQDIDVIYIYGNIGQVKILKPYIDINTAPFATPAPLFTTSSGFSTNLSIADLKDLNGVKFSEMPWLLPSRKQQQALAQEMQTLWQGNDDNTTRLFALGFDAFKLIPHLAQMRVFPSFEHKGLSGELSITPEGVVNRQLSWAQYSNEKIVEFKSIR